jgi:hypothetical protein
MAKAASNGAENPPALTWRVLFAERKRHIRWMACGNQETGMAVTKSETLAARKSSSSGTK